jgi:hypothetical protein
MLTSPRNPRKPVSLVLACGFFLAGSLLICPAAANVFGDGDPANGAEDERVVMNAATYRINGIDGAPVSGGTIYCEGEIRGSAIVLDVEDIAPGATGDFLATAAHVLWDLDGKRQFRDCEFRYQGLAEVPGFQLAIDPRRTRSGQFDPAADRGSPGFGREDWAVVHLSGEHEPWPGKVKALEYQSSRRDHLTHFFLVAFNDQQERMSLSGNCTVLESTPGDLGGGAWAGQLLDDCDSGPGASGGGLLAQVGDQRFLVGIRTGAHWSAEQFPVRRFPDGPPAGSIWNIQVNTNFSRAVDADLLEAIRDLAGQSTPFTADLENNPASQASRLKTP